MIHKGRRGLVRRLFCRQTRIKKHVHQPNEASHGAFSASNCAGKGRKSVSSVCTAFWTRKFFAFLHWLFPLIVNSTHFGGVLVKRPVSWRLKLNVRRPQFILCVYVYSFFSFRFPLGNSTFDEGDYFALSRRLERSGRGCWLRSGHARFRVS